MQSVINGVRQVCSTLHQLPVLQLLTHSSSKIACFCCNLQNFSKKFWCRNHWQGVILWFGQDSGITSPYNDSGQYSSFLPPFKINFTTLLNIFARSITSNLNFVILWNENMLRRELRWQNKTLHYEISRKWYFAFFKKTGHSRMIVINESKLLR